MRDDRGLWKLHRESWVLAALNDPRYYGEVTMRSNHITSHVTGQSTSKRRVLHCYLMVPARNSDRRTRGSSSMIDLPDVDTMGASR